MLVSDNCRKQIVEPSEGRGPPAPGGFKVYRDCVGVVTGGFGHTAAAGAPIPRMGDVWSADQCDAVLATDLAAFSKGLSALLAGVQNIQQREFDALGSLSFNIGLGNLRTSSLLAAYKRGDKATAARKFMDWNRAGGKPVAGLTARRKREAAWFLDGRLARTGVSLLSADDLPIAHVVDHADGWLAQLWHGWRSGVTGAACSRASPSLLRRSSS